MEEQGTSSQTQDNLDLSVCGRNIDHQIHQQSRHKDGNHSGEERDANTAGKAERTTEKNRVLQVQDFKQADEELKRECEGLEVGQVHLAPNFHLRNAMQAMEVMNPKMDSGFLQRQTVPVEERVRRGSFEVVPQAHELPTILDKLTRLEVSWMDGNSLAQTVKTCLWTQPSVIKTLQHLCGLPLYQASYEKDSVKDLRDTTPNGDLPRIPPHTRLLYPHLRVADVSPIETGIDGLERGSPEYTTAFALLACATSSLKTVELASFVIEGADLFEDEDYYAWKHSLDFCYTMTTDEVLALLRDAEAMLMRSARAASEKHDAKFDNALIDLTEQLGNLSLGNGSQNSSEKRGRRRKKKTAASGQNELRNAAMMYRWTKDGSEQSNPLYYQRLASVLEGFGLTDIQVDPLSSFNANGPPPKSALSSYYEERETALKIWKEYQCQCNIHVCDFEREQFEFSLPPTVAPLCDDPEEALSVAIALIHRVRLRRTLLLAYHNLYDKTFQRHELALNAVSQTQMHLLRIRATSRALSFEDEHHVDPTCDDYLSRAASQGTHAVDLTTEGRSISIQTDKFDEHVPGFDYTLHKPLLLPSPPRCAPLPTYKGAFEYLQKHLRHLALLCCTKYLCARNDVRDTTENAALREYWKEVSERAHSESEEQPKRIAVSDHIQECHPLGPSVSAIKSTLGEAGAKAISDHSLSTEKDGRIHVSLQAALDFQDVIVNDGANALARAYLGLLMLRSHNKILNSHSLSELIQTTLTESGIAFEYVRLNDVQKFIHELLVRPVLNVLFIGVLSPTRRRRRMDALLQDWSSIQMYAQEADHYVVEMVAKYILRDREPPKYKRNNKSKSSTETEVVDNAGHTRKQEEKCLEEAQENQCQQIFSWTSLLTVKLMLDHLRAGIRDKIFGVTELPYAYTYNAYLLNIRLNAKRETTQARQQLQAHVEKHGLGTIQVDDNSESNKTGAPPMPPASTVPRSSYHRVDVFKDEIESLLSRAVTRLLVISMKSRMLPLIHTTSPFTTPAIQYQHRFADFSVFYDSSPRALSFKEMNSAIALTMGCQRLLADAVQLLTTAKTYLIEVKEMIEGSNESSNNSSWGMLRSFGEVKEYIGSLEKLEVEKLIRVCTKNTVFAKVISQLDELSHADRNYERIDEVRSQVTDQWRNELSEQYRDQYENQSSEQNGEEQSPEGSVPTLRQFLSFRAHQNDLRVRLSKALKELEFPPVAHEVCVEFSEHSMYPVMSVRKSSS
eukprot:gb/GECG01015143.1/.p1 GENE.gb/GECG01015143.1/~~gb/GECG01015143.1/.p1  ORF type:complete len:1243 (+),score=171.31 gb/GECG01015143.1/:1-3729(+)